MADRRKLPIEERLASDLDLSLVANFAHQIINPLNGVVGTLDRIIEGKIEDEFRKEQRLRAIRAQVENCVVLTRNLSYLAIGFGELSDIDKKTIVIPQNLIEAALFFQEEAESKGVKIRVLGRDVQNTVHAHPDLIRQVFMNIFDNGVKYSKDDTEIVIRHWVQKKSGDAIIQIESEPSQSISSSDLKRIFEVGFRGENARNIIASGTGLGLYICKKIIETAHLGRLQVTLKQGCRVEFEIRLPNALEGKSDRRYQQ